MYFLAHIAMSVLSVNSLSGSSLASIHQLQQTQASLSNTLTQLATGSRINSAKDDPAGLIAQELLRADITASNAAIKSTQRANLMLNVAESGMSQISSLLLDAKALAVESANTGAMSSEQIEANQMQMNAILDSIDRFSSTTNWLGKNLLDGSLSSENGGATIQLGTKVNSANQTTVNLESTRTTDVGANSGSLYDLRSGGAAALASNPALAGEIIDAAISQIATQRGSTGATQKYTLDTNVTAIQDSLVELTGALSLVSDTDYAVAASNLARDQILMMAGLSALSIGNQNASNALTLLGG